MAATAVGSSCAFCRAAAVEDAPVYRYLRRVTSDCRPWPAGGRIGVCATCAGVQKPVDDAFRAEIDAIYRSYAIYHQADGAEQAVFAPATGLPTSRSAMLLDTFRRHAGLPSHGRMLDIGCGNGATIRAFQAGAPGWTHVGTEFDDRYRREVESIPNTECMHVGEPADVPGTFDVITMIHVLEHLVDPIAFLASLHGKLAAGGVLLVEVPHHVANPFELLIADHRSHFDARSLRRVLAAAGYGIVVLADDWIPKELSAVARPVSTPYGEKDGDATAVTASLSRDLEWLRRTADRFRALAAHGPLGLFGTSIAGTWLAAEAGEGLAFFVDEDPARIGKHYLGRPVLAPADVPDAGRVFVGLPTTLATAICRRLARPGVTFIPPD